MRSLKPSPIPIGNGYTQTDEILRMEGVAVLARSLEDFFTGFAW